MGVGVGDGVTVAVAVALGRGVLVGVTVEAGRWVAVTVEVVVDCGNVASVCTATFTGVEPQAVMREINMK